MPPSGDLLPAQGLFSPRVYSAQAIDAQAPRDLERQEVWAVGNKMEYQLPLAGRVQPQHGRVGRRLSSQECVDGLAELNTRDGFAKHFRDAAGLFEVRGRRALSNDDEYRDRRRAGAALQLRKQFLHR